MSHSYFYHSHPAINRRFKRAGFTLIELLIAIGVLAVLAIVVLITINPVEHLKQGKDANRIDTMNHINTGINLYQGDVRASPLGSSSIVYVSVPDLNATTTNGTTCTNMGLPRLAPGYTYHCAASSTYRKTNGTGWIPVNFDQMSTKSPFGVLPIDPVNTTTTGSFFAYLPSASGTWAAWSMMESQRYFSNPGSNLSNMLPGVYTTGSDPSLAPIAMGLVGYWPLLEGGGSTLFDGSYYKNDATVVGSVSWSSGNVEFNPSAGGYGSVGNPPPYDTSFSGLSLSATLVPTILSGSTQFIMGIPGLWSLTAQNSSVTFTAAGTSISATILSPGVTSLINGVFDGSSLSLFASQTRIAGPVATALTNTGSGGSFSFGGTSGLTSFQGRMGNVRVYGVPILTYQMQKL